MTLLRIVVVLVVAAFSMGAAPAKWIPIETVEHRLYTLTVEHMPGATVDDDSPRLRIRGPHGENLLVTAEGGLVPLAEGFVFNKTFAATNEITSKHLFIARRPPHSHRHMASMLLVLGRAYASDPGSTSAVVLQYGGTPKLLLTEATFEPAFYGWFDGEIVLAGNPSYSQTDGSCAKTYDPFAVYRLQNDRFAYAPDLSERYNRKHYFGWKGRGPREDLRVITCGKQKGQIVKVREPKR